VPYLRVSHCRERSSLHSEINSILTTMITIIQQQRDAINEGNTEEALVFDKQLELCVGDKERAFGALRQHIKEHGC